MKRDADGNGHQIAPVLEFMRSLWALDHALQRASIRMEAVLGLTAPQRFVIRILGALPRLTPADLAALLHVDRGSVTALLKRLEARELVARSPDHQDGRRVLLSLTLEGQLLDIPTEETVEAATGRALRRLKPNQIADARTVIRALTAALRPEAL